MNLSRNVVDGVVDLIATSFLQLRVLLDYQLTVIGNMIQGSIFLVWEKFSSDPFPLALKFYYLIGKKMYKNVQILYFGSKFLLFLFYDFDNRSNPSQQQQPDIGIINITWKKYLYLQNKVKVYKTTVRPFLSEWRFPSKNFAFRYFLWFSFMHFLVWPY